MAINHRKF